MSCEVQWMPMIGDYLPSQIKADRSWTSLFADKCRQKQAVAQILSEKKTAAVRFADRTWCAGVLCGGSVTTSVTLTPRPCSTQSLQWPVATADSSARDSSSLKTHDLLSPNTAAGLHAPSSLITTMELHAPILRIEGSGLHAPIEFDSQWEHCALLLPMAAGRRHEETSLFARSPLLAPIRLTVWSGRQAQSWRRAVEALCVEVSLAGPNPALGTAASGRDPACRNTHTRAARLVERRSYKPEVVTDGCGDDHITYPVWFESHPAYCKMKMRTVRAWAA